MIHPALRGDGDPVAALTLAEKLNLIRGHHDWFTYHIDRPGVCVPAIEVGDGPHGIRQETGEDMVWVPATAFPTASALGASWDRELLFAVGQAIGREARDRGISVVLGPGINMKRSPLCGRNFEYFGEDPHHSGVLGAAYVAGVQSQGVGACVKHLVANNQEIERTRISVIATMRTLREIYLPAFEHVITQAKPWLVMCSYNRLHGIHTSQHRWLLTELVRDEWQFDGVVVSDWDAVHDRVAALAAGLDLEMPGSEQSTAAMLAAVTSGELDEGTLDVSVRRILTMVAGATPTPPVATPSDHHELARTAAASCLTLLRNQPGPTGVPVLPLTVDPSTPMAVIGAYAEHPRIQGGGSAGVQPTRVDAALPLMKARVGDQLRYAPGFIHTPLNAYQDDLDAWFAAHGWTFDDVPGSGRNTAVLVTELRKAAEAERQGQHQVSAAAQQLIDQAVQVAESCGVILALCGLPLALEQEANDRTTLALPADQQALLTALGQLKRRTGAAFIVVVSAGAPITMDPWHDDTDAIIYPGLAGQAGAGALVDALWGELNPSGKLAETFPLALRDTPSAATWDGERGEVLYGEGVMVGYRWYDYLDHSVRYPFGHGLSYTQFMYSNLQVAVTDPQRATVQVSFTVTNSGSRPGREVAQVYVADPHATVRRPPHELRQFESVTLDVGASARVAVCLTARDFSYWDDAIAGDAGFYGGWRLEGGAFDIMVGSSSRDLRLTARITLPGTPGLPPVVNDAALFPEKTSRLPT